MTQTRLHPTHFRALAVLIIIALAFALFVPAAPAHAASISVPCDSAALFAALITAGSNSQADTITLSAGCTYQTTLVLPVQPDGGALTTIEGNGATIQMIGSQGVLELWENTNATINNLTLTDGDNPFQGGAIFTDVGSTLILTNSTLSNSSADQGGGIYARGVSATLTNVTISGSSATLGGGVFVENGTAMTIANSVIRSNAATDDGGGLFVNGTAALSLINTAVSGNTATNDGGGLENFGQSTISASTFSANTAITGAGIHNGSQATMTNTTLSGNIALGSGGGIFSDAASTFYNSTFSANSAASGGNIYRNSGAFTMVNSIAANNAGGGDCAGASPTVGNTLVEDGSCGVTSGSGGNLTGDPNLGPLANNGGATLTHALLTGSIAGNAGDNSNVPSGVTTDQTGAARIQGGTVDMGSVEGAGGGTSLVTISPAAASVLEGDTASLTVSRTGSTIDPMIVTFSTGGSAPGADFSAGTQVTIPGGSASANLDVVTTSNAVDDGDRTVVVTLTDGAAYDLGANITSTVTITDDDTAGVTVTPTSGLITTEAGGTDTFTVVLLSQPTADVSIAVASSDTTEGTAAPTPLTFTSATWNVAQTVTVTGVDDDVDDGNAAYSVTLSATSADGNYNAIVLPSVSVTNTDDDTAGVSVTPTSGLVTTEAGGTDTFTVVLLSQPTADVTIAVASSDTTEGTAAPTPLTFTSATWNVAQTVTVTGVDDDVDDGDAAYSVTLSATSADGNYNAIVLPSVSVTNTDDDTAGVTVTPTSGLVTTEAGGTDTFTVVLLSQPTADVSIAVASSDTTEGTAAPTPLTFTSANWNVAQTVTVTGVDDALADGSIVFAVNMTAASADAAYNGISVPSVSVTNQDDDAAGVTVSPSSGLFTTEAGGTAQFNVMLNSEPTADVTIAVASSDTAEGTAAPTPLTFTSANWNVAQSVTVTGVDDFVDDGDIAYTVTLGISSADTTYGGMSLPGVGITNMDDDTTGMTVTPTSGLVTTEAGGTAPFTVVLTSQPLGDVTVSVDSNNTAEGTAAPTPLTFTAANWNVAQTVTVTGVDDLVADGNVAYTVGVVPASAADSLYDGLPAQQVNLTNQDDDSAGVTVNPTSGLVTTEAGGTDTFTVVLTSQPTADVTVNVVSSNTAEGTAAPASLSFTAANWNVDQTVTVTGVDDAVADGSVAYTIDLSVSSSDIGYAGLSIPGVGVTNTDDDTAGLTAAPSGVSAAEGTGGSYQLSLSTVPSTPPLEITLTFDSTQLSVNGSTSPVLVTLTDTTPLTVNFMSLNNALVNTNRVVVITNTVSTSSAAEYPVGTTANVSVTITEGVAVVAVPTLPPPPPVEPAGALNFDEDSVVRVSVPDALGDVVRARVMYARGSAETWLGAPLYDAGNIGNQGVVDLGVLQAIDIFSANGQTYYDGGAVFCLQGQGTLIWMPASQSPRAPQIIGSYTVPEFPGFTCATLFEPGTLVLVSQNPLQ